MPPYILYIFEMTNAPLDYRSVRCKLVYGVPVMGVHIRMCKDQVIKIILLPPKGISPKFDSQTNYRYKVVYISVCSMQLMHVSVWCAPTGVSYKQVQKYRVFIIIFIFMLTSRRGFDRQQVRLNSIHLLAVKTIYMGEVNGPLVRHPSMVMGRNSVFHIDIKVCPVTRYKGVL